MAKIPFDVKYRPQIESGEFKVETGSGAEVKIVCWDADEYWPIVGIVNHSAVSYRANGSLPSKSSDSLDLFLITPEPELSEFEEKVRVCVTENLTTHIKDGNGREMSSTVFIDDNTAKGMAAELLTLARKEIEKDLPRWRKATGKKQFDERVVILESNYLWCTDFAEKGEYYSYLSDLEKLPKEDEK